MYASRRGMSCTKGKWMILVGVVLTFIGFVITIYGNVHKSFWDEGDSWCTFCNEDRLETLQTTKNCRTVGPIFLGLGVLIIIIGIITIKKENASQASQEGVTVMPYSATTTTTGAAVQPVLGAHPLQGPYPYPQKPGPVYPPPGQQNVAPYPPPVQGSYQQGYPQQPGYPHPTGYPPQAGGYPPQQGGYPPQQGGYPPQQDYPPPQGYPPPEGYQQQAGGYQPPAYPPPPPAAYPEKEGLPPPYTVSPTMSAPSAPTE